MDDVAAFADALAWPVLIVALLLAFRSQAGRFAEAVAHRVEHGDAISVGWLTLGSSVGELKAPPTGAAVTDDHIALVHRSWRVPHRDAEFGEQPMYEIHVMIHGENEALDRVEYVIYRLDPVWPNPVRATSDRKANFELYELANGWSLIRAEIKIRDQAELIHLSRFVDLMPESPKLRGSLLPAEPFGQAGSDDHRTGGS